MGAVDGNAKRIYKSLGADHRKMASLMGKAKELKRTGTWIQSSSYR